MMAWRTLSLSLSLSLSTAAAVQVEPMDVLASLKTVLDEIYHPVESTASAIKTFVTAGSGPITSPTRAEAGLVSGTPKSDLATALWISYEDVGTNGLWIAYNDSSILGYWNINGVASRHTQHMYRPGGLSSCPAIESTATCPAVTVGSMRPASCDAVADNCQTYHSVNARGDPTEIARQRWYDPKVRGWWLAAANYPLGQPYWIDIYSTVGYQNSDTTLPLLIGYYAVPVVDSAGMQAIVLIQMWYDTIATALASFNHMANTVVYVMEASTGELVATSNGEAIYTESGAQKTAITAATELISSSAARIESIRAAATGTYSDPNNRISTTVIDYQRASGSLHHKIVLASYLTTSSGTIVVPTSAPVIVPAPAVPAPACPTAAPAASGGDGGAVIAAIACITLAVVLALGLVVTLKMGAASRAQTGSLASSDGVEKA